MSTQSFVAFLALQIVFIASGTDSESSHVCADHNEVSHEEEHMSLLATAQLRGTSIDHFVEDASLAAVQLADATENSAATKSATCAPLKNRGTHFTVEIQVGTPPQKFDVVADTGSDALIVTSCACVKAGHCDGKLNRCFQGTNKSSTFAVKDGPHGPPMVSMMFGSGPVQAVVASDTVRVGQLRTQMPDGVLLMTDHKLKIQGQFEGILGLGLPASSAAQKGLYNQEDAAGDYAGGEEGSQGASAMADELKKLEDALKKQMGMSFLQQAIHPPAKHGHHTEKSTHEEKEKSNETPLLVKGFMEEAGIDRFSMCFNDGSDGVLRLDIPEAPVTHGSVGTVHWGLDFRGMSVGSTEHKIKVEICSEKNMTKNQSSPCGAIPDSGTTAIMAPEEQLITLYESMCDGWERCKENHTAMMNAAENAKKAAIEDFGSDPWQIAAASKAMIFQNLILDCKAWLTKDNGLNELPDIHFDVRGADGTHQTLSLAAWSYIIETHEKDFKYVYKNIPGLGKVPVGKSFTGSTTTVCSPAFSTMEYNTENNGPVWIFGTPLFYEYQVGYDLSTKPPAMSFSDEKCGSCGEEHEKEKDTEKEKASFMNKGVFVDRSFRTRQPRQVLGPFRMPDIDVTQPL